MKSRRTITVDELDKGSGELIRLVRDENVAIDVSLDGEVVAAIVPIRANLPRRELDEAWARHLALAEEIGAAWPEGATAVEAIREQRREL